MASWMEERDRLVEQTRAFVAGVAAAAAPSRQSDLTAADATQGPAAPDVAAETVPAPATSVGSIEPIAMPPRLKPVAAAVSERAEIIQRVAAFQAHQSRVSRERDAFYEATQSKIRDVLGNEIKPESL